jgi:hypothetical protein
VREEKGKERRAFLLLALEASWPIGEAPSPRTLGDSSEGDHPISEDARRLLGREQLASRGKHRYVRGDGKPHQIQYPNPPSTESVWRHWDSNHRPHRSKFTGASSTTSPLVERRKEDYMYDQTPKQRHKTPNSIM